VKVVRYDVRENRKFAFMVNKDLHNERRLERYSARTHILYTHIHTYIHTHTYMHAHTRT